MLEYQKVRSPIYELASKKSKDNSLKPFIGVFLITRELAGVHVFLNGQQKTRNHMEVMVTVVL